MTASGYDPDAVKLDMDGKPVAIPLNLILPLIAPRHLLRKQCQAGLYPCRHGIERQTRLARVGRKDRPRDQRLIDIALQRRGRLGLRTLYHGVIAP
jgi:hypothetical protein